jgi:quercetin dioxygenase-like cupin family protein
MPDPLPPAAAAEAVLPVRELAPCQAFLEGLGFRLVSIFPADAPRCVVMEGFGRRVRLQVGEAEPALAPANGAPATFAIRRGGEADWVQGRAGMLYQDLIPGRQGGAWIASRIRIERGGPVPDYVHWHDVHAQVIHCLSGEVRVVYEDQGPPFWLRAGDTVLQPPGIRHRVLECADRLEVLELSSPADHVTHVEHELALPTANARPERRFHGQRFVWHRAERAAWQPWRAPGWEGADTGVAAATGGAVAVTLVRGPRAARGAAAAIELPTGRTFWFVTRGTAELAGEQKHALEPGSGCVLPPHTRFLLRATSPDLALLEIAATT